MAKKKVKAFVKEALSGGKIMYSLLLPEFLKEVAEIMTIGAEKYDIDNWKKCKDKKLYIDALFRHIEAWRLGEQRDEETDKHHLAHACCNLMFLFWMDFNKPLEEVA